MAHVKVSKGTWTVDREKCINCGDCVFICPVGALKMKKGIPYLAYKDACCGQSCRICEYHCQTDAIQAY